MAAHFFKHCCWGSFVKKHHLLSCHLLNIYSIERLSDIPSRLPLLFYLKKMFYVYLQTWLNRKDCDKPSVSQKNLSPRSWLTSQYECGMIKRQASEKLSTSIDLLLVTHAHTHTHTYFTHQLLFLEDIADGFHEAARTFFLVLFIVFFSFLGSCDNSFTWLSPQGSRQ
jgi:hypothetical protein